jgi:hypothetical protein
LSRALGARKLFLYALATLLTGYAFFGRGFAYIGYPPLFIGEIVLAMGLLLVVPSGGVEASLRSPVSRLIVALMTWGAICTVPFISTYQLDALRDAAIWGYGSFALLVATCLIRSPLIYSIPRFYAGLLPFLLLWSPVAAWMDMSASHLIPSTPGTDVPLVSYKAGDAAVHLAGAGAFLLLGLHRVSRTSTAIRRGWIWAIVWLSGLGFAASVSRGGMLAVVCALSILFLFRGVSVRTWIRAVAIALAAAVLVLAFEARIDSGARREVSPSQIAMNLLSTVGSDGVGDLQGTKVWRLRWWSDIIEYTVFGEHFWRGKGFGINLAFDDGYASLERNRSRPLRSPHNAHATMLARAGVPGLALWGALQACFAYCLVRAYRRAQRSGHVWWAKINLWILCYWSAFIVNGAFDVFLESPQGGILFWSLIGFGIAALETQRRLALAPSRRTLEESATVSAL